MRSVEVCAGAGGQALGLELAGFDHAACVELDPAACNTLRRNRPNWNVIEADLTMWEPTADLHGVELLAGGVPCPPFSLAGRQLGRDDDRDLFPQMLRLAEQMAPRVVMIENVRGILARKFEAYRAEIVRDFERLGYQFVGWELFNAADFGVPQSRRRAILIMADPDVAAAFTWPEPNGEVTTIGDVLEPYMAEAGWAGAEEWAELAQGIAPALVGGSKKHGGADLGPTRAKASWRELGVDGLGVADGPPGPEHQGMPRLTVQMAAAVQGFPRDWIFEGRKTAAYRQVGNAFPPPVAAAIGLAVALALKSAEAEDTPAA